MRTKIVKNASFEQRFAPGDVHLRLLNLTDLHMEIRPYDYFADRETKTGGLARAASLVDRLRTEAPNTLLFDNGDILQGNPMGDFAVEDHARNATATHPMIAALNALGPDAATIGNHEFDYGLDFLQSALSQASFPVLSANLLVSRGQTVKDDKTLLPPYTLLDRSFVDVSGNRHTFKVGVIGLLPPQVLNWDRKHLAGRVEVRGIVETARAYVPEMRTVGADIIVALSHSGIGDGAESPGQENASLSLAMVDGIDAIITGHSHLVFPGPDFGGVDGADAERGFLNGIPATMAGFGGSHVGVIDLRLVRNGNGWDVRDTHVEARAVPVGGLPPSPIEQDILAKTAVAHVGTLSYIRQPVGHTDIPLESYFAMLEPSPSVLFVASAQAWYMRQALRGTTDADLPLLSAAASFKIGGRGGPDHFTDVPAGPVAMRHVADLYSYPNMLCALRVTGAALIDWLEFSAGFFHKIRPGTKAQALVDPTFPSYNFDTITGLTYEIDVSQPQRFSKRGACINPGARRVRHLSYDGTAVTNDMMFIVATNDYRASRGGGFPGADDSEVVLTTPDAHRDVLVQYLKATDGDRTLAMAPWTLRQLSDTSVVIETGEGANRYPERLNSLQLEPIGTSRAGFLQFLKPL
ncbi:MAG: bifunctional 2',3'-cyclic-nucleotide 2'-phosphodiesterase/3'-nucleotidase [Pseudomonadota bacterium]